MAIKTWISMYWIDRTQSFTVTTIGLITVY